MSGAVRSVKKAVSSIGKTARKIIPNEVADVAVKAAPFVAPFNPLLAGGMAAIGSYDQTGSFGRALKSGLFTYGGGQLARGIGGAGFQKGFNPFGGLPSGSFGIGSLQLGASPIGTETGLKLGQYEIFGGTPPTQGVGEQIADQGIINRSNALVGQPVPGADPGVFVEQTTLPLEQATKQLTQTNINEAAKKTTGDLLKTIVSPQSTLGERGTALKDLGGKALKTVFLNKDGSIDKLAVGATIAGATSYMEAKKLAEEAELVDDADEYTEEMYEADKARYDDYYEQILPEEAFGLKEGGRVGLQGGGIPSITLEKKDYNFMDLIDEDAEEEYYKKKADELDRKYNPQNYNDIIPKEKPLDQFMLNEIMGDKGMNTLSEEARDDAMKMYAERAFKKGQISEAEYNEIMGFKKGGRVSRRFGSSDDGEKGVMSITLKSEDDGKKLTGIETLQDEDRLAVFPKDVFSANEISRLFSDKSLTTNMERKQLYKILMNPGQFPDAEMGLKKLLGRPIEEFKKGGRVQYAMGSPEQNAMAASGISEIPLNVNPAGATELDMRNTGGFVPPVGVKEKADDIPAMLSNNEFVFTADAVRAAGGGSVNKGAKRMYDLMKSLEGKVV